ncbi:CBS domain-containing protein [Salinigranum sp. GCM10025319]|uniref:CBS domain-containing protein n=1 Tax=Salinigranum sp. GCM10025319 TaxID=3252687 RepID=UPI003614D8B8
MLVSEITKDEVVTVAVTESLQDAVTAMHESATPYCIVEVDGIPSGLLTEHDALDACRRSGRPLGEISLEHFATGFEGTVEPDKTVYYAVGLMISHDLEVLPVRDGLDIVGVLTQDDVMGNLTTLTRETVMNLRQKGKWR